MIINKTNIPTTTFHVRQSFTNNNVLIYRTYLT